ncbi:MAG: GntR family transcriptional regulator [Clostridia bacterium]|nr:GntR family transcriptional regulator [Clostridia bacterium]
MPEKFETPVYARIALDLARKIASGELVAGSRLSGRSLLSSTYRVSPETIRRSMHLLEDMGIVRAESKVGYVVLSKEQAQRYVERFKTQVDLQAVRNEIESLLQDKQKIEDRIYELMDYLARQADRLTQVNPIYPCEIQVDSQSPLVGLTLSETKFWQNTGGTIVAIRRDGRTIYSPGPYAVFQPGDLLLITGDESVEQRVLDYIGQTVETPDIR